ncbi:MAG: hypothetical protein WA919_21355 [Coleofasciculaceae cyanobacterium]
MGRAAKLKQQRRHQDHEITDSHPANVKYALFEPKNKNYLASIEALGGMQKLNWCPHPGGAHRFATSSQAQAKAKRIKKDRGYSLEVVAVTEEVRG